MNNPNHIHYNLKGTGVTLSPEVRDYLDKKIPHIEKSLHWAELSVLDVELSFDAGQQTRKYHAAFNLVADSHTLHAKADGDTLHEAIDIAMHELSREAVRIKTKKLHAFRRGALHVKEFFRGFRRKL